MKVSDYSSTGNPRPHLGDEDRPLTDRGSLLQAAIDKESIEAFGHVYKLVGILALSQSQDLEVYVIDQGPVWVDDE